MNTDTHQHPYKELKLMALDVLKQLGKPKSFNLVLLSLMEQQLHAAYILGRTDADYDAGRVLTDIETQT